MKKIIIVAVAMSLAGCLPAMSQQEVAAVQKACADLGLVSNVGYETEKPSSVTCKKAKE